MVISKYVMISTYIILIYTSNICFETRVQNGMNTQNAKFRKSDFQLLPRP